MNDNYVITNNKRDGNSEIRVDMHPLIEEVEYHEDDDRA